MHFALLLLLLINTFVHSMEREVTQEKENTNWFANLGSSILSKFRSIFDEDKGPTPEAKLRALAQVIRKQKKFPSLKELALTAIATKKTSDLEFARKLAKLPADLHESVKKAFLQHHMVEILERFPLEPVTEYVGKSEICPNRKYLFSRIAEDAECKVFELQDNERKLIGAIEALPVAITHDSKYAISYTNNTLIVTTLPDLERIAMCDCPRHPYGMFDKYYVFDSDAKIIKTIRKGSHQPMKEHDFSCDPEEIAAYNSEMYICMPHQIIAYQWKHYFLAHNDHFEELATIPYINSSENVISAYWNKLFDEFLRKKGLKDAFFTHCGNGAISTNGDIFSKALPDSSRSRRNGDLLSIDADSLDSFTQKTNVFIPPQPMAGNSRQPSRISIHPNGHVIMVHISIQPTDGISTCHQCLYIYDHATQKTFALLEIPNRGYRPKDFWFSTEGDIIYTLGGSHFFMYDLKNVLSHLSLKILADLVVFKK